jgi:ferrous-iron efflux pump FieF
MPLNRITPAAGHAYEIIEQRRPDQERTALLGLIVNLAQLPFSLYAAWIANSYALWADVSIVVSDTTLVFLSWMTLRALASYDRTRYNYGLSKLESVAAFGVALGQCFSLVIILAGAIGGILQPKPLEGQGFGLIVVAVSFFAYAALGMRALLQWRRHPTPIIGSQWKMYFINVGQAVVIIVPLGLASISDQPWTYYLDPAASLLLAGFMIYFIVSLFRQSFFDVIDRATDTATLARVHEVLDLHAHHYKKKLQVRTRRAGGRIFIENIIEFEPDTAMRDVQHFIDVSTAQINAEIASAHVHFVSLSLATAEN